jgi:hypothetical protein
MDLLKAIPPLAGLTFCSFVASAQPLPPDGTYRPLPTQPADVVRKMIGSGQDADLKTFAEEILPIVLQHLEMAQNLHAELTGAAP